MKTARNQDGSIHPYLQIVESRWVAGRPRQRVVAPLGRLDALAACGLDRRHPRTPWAQRGYSKDRRPDRQQILLGLWMTRDGLLVGHWVFPGATVDHRAMAPALQDLQVRWPITRLIVVGDRGMFAPHLLEWLVTVGWEYILGQPVRRRRGVDAISRQRGRYPWVRRADGTRALGVKEAPGPQGDRLIRPPRSPAGRCAPY